jgi:hypothetical protein
MESAHLIHPHCYPTHTGPNALQLPPSPSACPCPDLLLLPLCPDFLLLVLRDNLLLCLRWAIGMNDHSLDCLLRSVSETTLLRWSQFATPAPTSRITLVVGDQSNARHCLRDREVRFDVIFLDRCLIVNSCLFEWRGLALWASRQVSSSTRVSELGNLLFIESGVWCWWILEIVKPKETPVVEDDILQFQSEHPLLIKLLSLTPACSSGRQN